MRSHQKFAFLLLAALALTVWCALAASAEQGQNDSLIKQQSEAFTFVNDTGMAVDGLAITFDVNDVKTTGSVTFSKAITVKREITLSKDVVSSGGSTGVSFERDGPFHILSWQWTANGAGTGVHQGPPVSSVNPGSPGSGAASGDGQPVTMYRGFPKLGGGEIGF